MAVFMTALRKLTLLYLLCLHGVLVAGPVPALLAKALEQFRVENPPGWSYLQTTVSGERTRTERYDPSVSELLRWTLESDGGRAPTKAEKEEYLQLKIRRSSPWNAPRIEKQLDLESCESLEAPDGWLLCRFRLKPGDAADAASAHLRVSLRLHRASGVIDRVEIENTEPFWASLGVRIQESRTVLSFSLPAQEKPSFLTEASMRVRGRLFLVKELAQDMRVTWTDFRKAKPSTGP